MGLWIICSSRERRLTLGNPKIRKVFLGDYVKEYKMMKKVTYFITSIAILLFFSVLALTMRKEPKQNKRPNIMLLSIDTWRADYFTENYMPKTYGLVKEQGILFPYAISSATWTLSAHASMLSGLLPSQHKAATKKTKVSEEVRMVQEDLKLNGYKTVAFTGKGYVCQEMGFSKGFDLWDEKKLPFENKESKHTFREFRERYWSPVIKAEKYLKTQMDDPNPLFIFVHTFYPHEYYLWANDKESYLPDGFSRPNVYLWIKNNKSKVKICYEAAIRDLDEKLAHFITTSISYLGPNHVIIITSDHGECLGEKHEGIRMYSHGNIPYAELIRVPFIMFIGDHLNASMKIEEQDRVIGTKDIPAIIRALSENTKFNDIYLNREYVVSEHLVAGKETQRSISVTMNGTKIFLDGNKGRLGIYTDKQDKTDIISQFGARQAPEHSPSEDMKKQLEALGYLN